MDATTLAKGALAGVAGTALMTVMMRKVAPRVMPRDMRPDEFVPRKVVEWAEEQAGEPHALGERQEMRAAYGAHFGYGTAMGTVYGALREGSPLRELPAPVAGALFGVAVWAVGFEGWMPALGVDEATTSKPPRKWPMPIMAHLVFGTSTALAYEMAA